MKTIKCDVCVIGAGSGGLSFAAGASQMGADVVLIEKHKMGGDCLNYGCVPSKSILAAGKMAANMKKAAQFGVNVDGFSVNYQKVHHHIHDVIAQIEPNDSVERFTKLGVNVIFGESIFVGPRSLKVNDTLIEAKYFVIATGSRAMIPPISGIESIKYLTNETIFDLTTCPKHLVIIGGGPIGVEMAQAHARLGAKVTIVSGTKILPNDDPEAVAMVRETLFAEGIILHEEAIVQELQKTKVGIKVAASVADIEISVTGSHLLMATGRRPNVDGLNLEKAGVEYSPKGIVVNNRLQTSNKKIYAIGDVAGGLMFTHLAGYHAGIAIRNILFKMPAKADAVVPWATYTDPEVAQVGLTENQALEQNAPVRVLKFPFDDNDRALAERQTKGFVKVVTTLKGKVIGATIVGHSAGEQLLPWVYAVQHKLPISAYASLIAPYPTRSEVTKRVAGSFYTPKLFSQRTQKVVQFLMKYFS